MTHWNLVPNQGRVQTVPLASLASLIINKKPSCR